MASVDTIKKNNYYPLDLTRFLMAFLVIVIHTMKWDSDCVTRILELAVPFFFLTSGFFLQKKSCSDKKPGDSEKLWVNKLIKLYFIWTLVYFPFSIFSFVYEGNTIVNCAMGMILGTGYYAWHLWYLVASIIGGGIICSCKLVKLNYVITFVFTLLCFITATYIDRLFPDHYLAYAVDRIVSGWFYIIIGMGIWLLFPIIKNNRAISIVVSFLLLICYLFFGGVLLFLGITALFVLILSICDQCDTKRVSDIFNGQRLRKMSADIYFVHMIFVGLLSLFVGVEDSFLKFIIVAIFSIIFTYVKNKVFHLKLR